MGMAGALQLCESTSESQLKKLVAVNAPIVLNASSATSRTSFLLLVKGSIVQQTYAVAIVRFTCLECRFAHTTGAILLA